MALSSTLANLAPADEAALIRRIEEVERQQREAGPALMAAISPMFDQINEALSAAQSAIAQVQAQQTALAAQQAALTAQVTRIDALVNSQVTGATATANTGGAVAIAAGISYGVASVSVPAGFTRASVIGVTSVTATGTSPALQVQTDISGSLGFSLPIYGSSGDIVATGATSHAATFTGLSGGSITVGGRVAGASGVTNAYFVNTVVATFFR